MRFITPWFDSSVACENGTKVLGTRGFGLVPGANIEKRPQPWIRIISTVAAALAISCCIYWMTRVRAQFFADQTLTEVRNLLQNQKWAEVTEKVTLAKSWFNTTRQTEEIKLLTAIADFEKYYLGDITAEQFSNAKISLEQFQPSSPFYGAAQFTLVNDRFFYQERFSEAEDLLEAALLVIPDHCQLRTLRLQLLAASGRWVEACEDLPIDVKCETAEQKALLIRQWTKVTFFPEVYLTEFDRRLGVLSPRETSNVNSDLDRLEHFITKDSRWSPPYAGLARWYIEHDLQEVAVQQMSDGKSAFAMNPTAVYLEEYLHLIEQQPKRHASDKLPNLETKLRTLASIASRARLAHAAIYLKRSEFFSTADSGGSCKWQVWPLRVDRALLELFAGESDSDKSKACESKACELKVGDESEDARAKLRLLNEWTIDRREIMLRAIHGDDNNLEVIAQCWEAFGQKELAEWIRR